MSYDLTNFEKAMTQFSDKIEIIVGLEVGGKFTPEEAYKQIKYEFKQLKKLRKKDND